MGDKGTVSDQEFFDQRGFGLRMGFGKRPALLVVDVMKGFTDPEMPLGSDLDAVVNETNRLLAAAHDRAIPVFFSVVYYEEENCRDAGIWALKQTGVFSLRAGTKAVELDARLDRRPDDVVFVKKFASCFFGSDLVSRLLVRGVDTLILAGCTTSGCIRATAVDACQYGFRAIVAREAVGDRSAASHRQSLFDLQAKYADVVPVDEVIAWLSGEGPREG
jgi:maleamate amidohydrolase